MSASSTTSERSAFLLLATGALAGGGELAARASDAWRGGGGVFLLLWAALTLLLALPLGLAELGRAASGAARGPLARTLGWLLLGIAALLLASRLARAGALVGGGLAGALLALMLVGATLGGAGRPRALAPMAGLALALVGLGALLALVAGGSDGLALLAPRPAALLHGETWGAAVMAALLSAPLLGLVGGLLPFAPERGRPGSQLVLAGLLAALLAQLGAVGAFGVLAGAPALPAASPPVGADLGLVTAAGAGGLGGLALGLAALGGALGLALALLLAAREAAERTWAGAGERVARELLLGAGLLAAGLCALGPPGLLAAELAGSWLAGVGLPLAALLVCLSARDPEGLQAAARAADRSGALRLVSWLPALWRYLAPPLLGVGLVGAVLTRLRRTPGEEEALALGPLGPLSGALHVVGPALCLVLLVALVSGLALAPARPRREGP